MRSALIFSIAIFLAASAAAVAAQQDTAAAPSPTATPAAPRPTAGLSAASEPTFAQRQRTLTAEIQNISITLLGSGDAAKWDEGRMRMLMIRDPAAAAPVWRILGIGSLPMRILACDVLGQIPGPESARLLARAILTEESDAVVAAAVKALHDRADYRGTPELVAALAKPGRPFDRAISAIGEIGDTAALAPLISRLKMPETHVTATPIPPRQTSFYFGTLVPYVMGATPVVGSGAVGWAPKIGYLPTGTGMSYTGPPGVAYHTTVEFVPQPIVLETLKKMTGQDFGYEAGLWRLWLTRQYRAQQEKGRTD